MASLIIPTSHPDHNRVVRVQLARLSAGAKSAKPLSEASLRRAIGSDAADFIKAQGWGARR